VLREGRKSMNGLIVIPALLILGFVAICVGEWWAGQKMRDKERRLRAWRKYQDRLRGEWR